MKGFKSKADVLKRVFDKYGDKYTLTIEEDYVHQDAKVLCTCNIHGTSKYVNLRHFLDGSTGGCEVCLKEKQREISKENFINKFIEKWGNNYSFEKLNYITWKDSGIITCKEHGDFELKEIRYAFDHVPCPICYEKHLTIQRNTECIKRLKDIYGDRYIWITTEFGDYYKDYVEFICPKHGITKQTLSTLLNTQVGDNLACPICRKEYANKQISYTLEDALNKAKSLDCCKHYDFSAITEWKGVKEYYTFRCKKHNEYFIQTFDQIFNAQYNGCKSCQKENREENFVPFYTNEEFAERARKIHGEKYDYSKVNYVTNRDKVCIICPKHGEFWQIPLNHIEGKCGCPKCQSSILETSVRVLLEENNIEYIPQKSLRDLTNEMMGEQPQKIDFFLPHHNLCIECQGEQHFFPVTFGKMSNEKAIKQHKRNLELDMFKYDALIKQNYDIIYFFKFNNLKYENGEWYKNKKCFYDVESLIEYIKTKDYDSIKREWYNQEKYILYKNNRKPKTIWNRDTCYKEAQKYNTRTSFYKGSQTAYGYACKNKWLEDYTWFKEMHHTWTYDECYSEALKYNSKKDFEIGSKNAYYASIKKHWIDDYTWFKPLWRKPIVQLTLDGHFVREWENSAQIVKSGIVKDAHNISECCRGKIKSSHGFIWKYKEDNTTNPTILQLTKDNVLVREWKDMSEIHKAKPINSTKHITKCLQGYMKTAGGFIWKYKEK